MHCGAEPEQAKGFMQCSIVQLFVCVHPMLHVHAELDKCPLGCIDGSRSREMWSGIVSRSSNDNTSRMVHETNSEHCITLSVAICAAENGYCIIR